MLGDDVAAQRHSEHQSCTAPPAAEGGTTLPAADRDQRLRWDLTALGDTQDARRRERGLTWKALATELGCTDHQVKGVRTVRFAVRMKLAMRMAEWLELPAAAFIYAAAW